MYFRNTIIIVIFSILPVLLLAQKKSISGNVYEKTSADEPTPLPGVNVYWAGTNSGTASDAKGYFNLEKNSQDALLVFSFIGYKNDTLRPTEKDFRKGLQVVLSINQTLKEVVISERVAGSHISRKNAILTQEITLGELKRAACCNLSESFETNASVDVSFSDAVTGAKHIKLLGLSGKYSQFQIENIPNLRGLATSFGLSYIPGSWMQSIQVSKGSASVKNGYESITGQINVELKKPDNEEKLFINVYGNHLGKIEGNINSSIKVSEHWSTAIMAHAENNSMKHDKNGDSFMDMPLVTQYNVLNRWKYKGDDWRAQLSVKYLNENRKGGQMDFNHKQDRDSQEYYGSGIQTNRFEAFTKTARFLNRPNTNIGFINSFIYHEMNSYFGFTDYNATEWNYYGNLMFQSYIGNTSHTYTTGISYVFDRYREYLNDSLMLRTEHVPGAFFEYTWTKPERFTLLVGGRVDYNSLYGVLFTPRLHFKYDLTPKTVLRASVGKGMRTPNAIADNISLLASSRQIIFTEELRMEKAWNFGINITQYAEILGRELSVNVEFYRTNFENQAIIDKDQDNFSIRIYNLDGKSFSNNFQVEAKYELIPSLDLIAAFRYNDVRITKGGNLMRDELVHLYKGLLSLSYATFMQKWQFDLTTQFNGPSRIPSTLNNPEAYQMPEESPFYTILNAQITKRFKRWELYFGGENLTNYKQNNPIIAADDPFGEYFDASNIWGPLIGIKIYAGIRVSIK